MVTRRGALLALCLALGPLAGAGAQDLAPQFSGRLETSGTWFQEALPGGGQTLGLVRGWAGLTAGTRDVKSELRLGLGNLPAPAVTLDRATVKFRFPGLRFTGGLGRLSWGPGFVLVPGDLLFDSVGGEIDWGADELRSKPAWLASAWMAWGDEAFAEALVLSRAAGLRVSAAPLGVTLEASGAWDEAAQRLKGALSTQFHAGLDWYGTFRYDQPSDAAWDPRAWTASAGAFGLWNPVDGLSFTTRHEGLVPGRGPWEGLCTYHDLSAVWDGAWTATVRTLWEARSLHWQPSAELRWGPLQNLSLFAATTLASPWAVTAGFTSKW